jgi:hypothetical protein
LQIDYSFTFPPDTYPNWDTQTGSPLTYFGPGVFEFNDTNYFDAQKMWAQQFEVEWNLRIVPPCTGNYVFRAVGNGMDGATVTTPALPQFEATLQCVAPALATSTVHDELCLLGVVRADGIVVELDGTAITAASAWTTPGSNTVDSSPIALTAVCCKPYLFIIYLFEMLELKSSSSELVHWRQHDRIAKRCASISLRCAGIVVQAFRCAGIGVKGRVQMISISPRSLAEHNVSHARDPVRHKHPRASPAAMAEAGKRLVRPHHLAVLGPFPVANRRGLAQHRFVPQPERHRGVRDEVN